MAKVKVNDIEIEYEIEGQGEPLLLIAGLGYSRWCWHRVIPDLAKKYRVISFDNRGVGGTDRTPGPYTAEMLADDTAGLLEALEIKAANIVGISMGGFIAQALITKRPDLCKRLVLMATGFGGPRHLPMSPEVMAQLTNPASDVRSRAQLSCADDFSERDSEFFEYWVRHRTENQIHPDGYKSQLAVGLQLLVEGKSFEADLQKVKAPTLIIFGKHDRLIPVENANLLQKAIPGSKLIVLPEDGHFLPLERPAVIAEELSKFIESTEAPLDQTPEANAV